MVRMRHFVKVSLSTVVDAVAIEKAALHDYPDNIVKRLLDHRRDNTGFLIRVRWLGGSFGECL